MTHKHIYHITNDGRSNGYPRHTCLSGMATSEDAKGEETKERTIGVGYKCVDKIHHTTRPYSIECQGDAHKEKGENKMSPLAHLLILLLAQNIDTGTWFGFGGPGPIAPLFLDPRTKASLELLGCGPDNCSAA